jgi:hypothetical protein
MLHERGEGLFRVGAGRAGAGCRVKGGAVKPVFLCWM